MDEGRCQGEIESVSLQKENERMDNNSGTEQVLKIYKFFKDCC